MKTAIISDIHGNMEAFISVLKDLQQHRISQTFCLGDCIGYGAEPHKVLDIIQRRRILSVLGNHELAMLRPGYLSWFNPIARKSLEKTRDMLSPTAMDQISQFPRCWVHDGCRLVHGFPPDLAKMYLFQASEKKLLKTFEKMDETTCFLGHTHQLELIAYDGEGIERIPMNKGLLFLKERHKYIINVGSVGQPRDGDNCAKYIIWDSAQRSIDVRFVPYDIAATVAKIERAGLPKAHARLFAEQQSIQGPWYRPGT